MGGIFPPNGDSSQLIQALRDKGVIALIWKRKSSKGEKLLDSFNHGLLSLAM